MKRSRPQHYVTLNDLIRDGVIRPPAELVKDYRGHKLSATIEKDGSVRWDGRAFASLSDAASAAKLSLGKDGGHPRINGWAFWKIATDDGLVSVGNLRRAQSGNANGT